MSGTTIGGQFGWGGTLSKMYRQGPMVNSTGSEIRCRVQEQKLAWLKPQQYWFQKRKLGLANLYTFLMRVRDDWKVTPGITELSRPRVHTFILRDEREQIDGAACYIDVGSSYPGCAEATKGGGVHPLKGIVSWVHNAVRQLVWYLLEMFDVCEEGSHSTRGTGFRHLWSSGYLKR
jgi:hypothetical protein